MNTSGLIQKVWNFCHTLRDDGLGYGDYLEQLTFLLFLKMADEYATGIHQARHSAIPEGLDWASLRSRSGPDLEGQYLRVLHELGHERGMLGAIFFKAQNKIQDPQKLARLVQLIDAEKWLRLGTDVKGDLYEGLLQKNAEDTKSGAGQYFTPRPLIRAIVECVRPLPMRTIADPACGTGGFFLAAHEWLSKQRRESLGEHLNPKEQRFLRFDTFHGWEIVPNTRRLCLMNLVLHGISTLETEPPIKRDDALLSAPPKLFDYVLANPPFGKKSSMTFTTEEGEEDRESLVYQRQDFWESTSNKQLNFLQHIRTMLRPGGQAAVVLPDNVLFEGGAGEKIRRKLLEKCDVHTILRLPTGIFYANGVKANVVFFENHADDGKTHTSGTWFYDLRTNQRYTLKTRPMRYEDLQDFIRCYHPENRCQREGTERFRFFAVEELLARDKASLDVFWLKDKSLDSMENLQAPDILAQEIVEHLEAALENFRAVAAGLARGSAESS